MLRRIPGGEGLDHETRNRIELITQVAAHKSGHDKLLDLVKDYPDLIDAPNENFETALHVASLHGRLNSVNSLIVECANMEARDLYGRTPLLLAVFRGHADVVDILLDHGADPNATDHRGNNTLHAACASSVPSRRIVLALLTKFANPEEFNIDYDTPCDVAHKKSPDAPMLVQVISNYLPVEDELDDSHDMDSAMFGMGFGLAMGLKVMKAYRKECKKRAKAAAKLKALADAEWEDMRRTGIRRPSVFGNRKVGKPGFVAPQQQRRLTKSEKDAEVIIGTVTKLAKYKTIFMGDMNRPLTAPVEYQHSSRLHHRIGEAALDSEWDHSPARRHRGPQNHHTNSHHHIDRRHSHHNRKKKLNPSPPVDRRRESRHQQEIRSARRMEQSQSAMMSRTIDYQTPSRVITPLGPSISKVTQSVHFEDTYATQMQPGEMMMASSTWSKIKNRKPQF